MFFSARQPFCCCFARRLLIVFFEFGVIQYAYEKIGVVSLITQSPCHMGRLIVS